MIYNSSVWEKAFSKIDAVYLKLAEIPEWFNGADADYAVLSDIAFNSDYYNEEEGFMRPGGSCVAVFQELKVSEIVFTLSDKLVKDSEYGNLINISDIVVLGV